MSRFESTFEAKALLRMVTNAGHPVAEIRALIDETYHTSHGSAHRHVKQALSRMTANAEEEPGGVASGVNAAGAAANNVGGETQDEE